MTLLSTIDSPDDLRKLRQDQLPQLCDELRSFIIHECANNPGHLGASLGVIELTVALHYVFDTPNDKLVWDVGHQAYAHKILTGRRDRFYTNRKHGGISGFPRMSESPYDAFGVGHSSTSVSAALGLVVGAQKSGRDEQAIAVIGDGALTGGLAFEGLNNAGALQPNMLVVLNDNNISIDKNVGALHQYLLKLTTSMRYNQAKRKVWDWLGQSWLRNIIQKFIITTKSAILNKSNFFTSLGFRYFGPVDGHNVIELVKTCKALKKIGGAKLLHIITVKGKGFHPAENNQTEWHAPGKYNSGTGERISGNKAPRYQDVFGETIVELAEQNEKIVGITPAMVSGCSLNLMLQQMPDRTFDVGIEEQHAVTFAAGLAAAGMVPFCNIYSSFMQRAYDSVIHDVALQELPVVFCLDRGGLVGEDGATHHGAYDLAFFRCIPNMTIAAPMNEIEMRNMLYTAQLPGMKTVSIRYPRGCGVGLDWKQPFEKIEFGTARKLRTGKNIAVLTIGHVGNDAMAAIDEIEKEGYSVTHYDMRFVKPLDEAALHEVGRNFKHVITVENGTIIGGMGSATAEFFTANGYMVQVTRLGIPDQFIEHGTPDELHADCGFDKIGIYKVIKEILKNQGT